MDTSEPQIAPTQPHLRRLLNAVYWSVWFVAVPLVLAYFFVWGLQRPFTSGALSWLHDVARDQWVPTGIVAFTVFEMALWAARQYLPLARYAFVPVRADLPPGMRGPFERARALLEEADAILLTHDKAIVRELSASERTKLREDLDALRAAMKRQPFDEEGFVEALVRADGEVDVRLGRWRKSEVREYLESILVAIGVAMALRAFVVEAFKIPSGSMIPTLQVGDHIFVNKFVYGPAWPFTNGKRVWTSMPPKRGDVMVFAFPEHPEQDFIKRVIALPGDKLEAHNGHPIINGWEVPSCYVGVYSYTESPERAEQLDEIPFGQLRNVEHTGDLFVEYLGDEAYLTLYDRAQGSSEHQGPWVVEPGQVMVMGDNRNNSHDSRLWYGGKGGGVPFANIRGRALFVWLSVTDNGIDWTRFGAPVMGRPRLPTAMSSLEPAMDKCLRERPAVTYPPAK